MTIKTYLDIIQVIKRYLDNTPDRAGRMKGERTMKVATREAAWSEANKIFPTDYDKDYAASERAGYDIYRHHTLNPYTRICDLGNRLEVLTGEYGETVTNIWIEADEPQEATQEVRRMTEYLTNELKELETELKTFESAYAKANHMDRIGMAHRLDKAQDKYYHFWMVCNDLGITKQAT